MFSGQRRWQRSDQGSASMGDLQENSKCPRESWWRFPEGDTALGAAGEVQEPMEKANQQWSEGLVWFCRGCFPGGQVWTTCGYSKSKEGVMNSGKWSVSFTKQPQCKKTAEQNKQKTAKPEKTSGKTLWGGSRKEENLVRIRTQNESLQGEPGEGCSLAGTAPAHILMAQNDEELIPLYLSALDWALGTAWIKGSVICSKGSFCDGFHLHSSFKTRKSFPKAEIKSNPPTELCPSSSAFGGFLTTPPLTFFYFICQFLWFNHGISLPNLWISRGMKGTGIEEWKTWFSLWSEWLKAASLERRKIPLPCVPTQLPWIPSHEELCRQSYLHTYII